MIAYKRNAQKGFTILEVMIAVAISSVLIAAVYQTFHSQQWSYTMQSEAVAMEQNLRGSLYLLTKELRSAGYNPTQATTNDFRFVTSFPVPNNLFVVNYADDHHFTVAFTLDTDGNGFIDANKNEQIAYKFDKDTKTLQRFNDMQADITKKWEIVSSNIDAVYFRYLDQNQDKANNPVDIAYVEVTMLARMGKKDSKYMNTTVYKNKEGVEGVKLCPLVSDECVNDYFGDHYHRRLLTTTIQIRNRLIPSS